jgi:hypothetical protein
VTQLISPEELARRLCVPKVTPGLCECGCGQRTAIAPKNDSRKGIVKGQHMRFVNGHNHNSENHPQWKGGRFIHKTGYVKIHSPDHPRAVGGYVFEHVLVMEKVLGRPILSTEAIHHIDEVRHNNDPGNLMLFAKIVMHTRFHGGLKGWSNGPAINLG